MSAAKSVVFLFNLVQDVNVLRGLVYLAARETEARLVFLVSDSFKRRDRQNVWQVELNHLAKRTAANVLSYASVREATTALEGGAGVIFAGSESNLKAHWETGDVFRAAPSSYLKITLQHGFECVGFRQSREHVAAHGLNVSFAADVVCAWFKAEMLTSMVPSERAKLYVAGPSFLLNRALRTANKSNGQGGLICENLHSVRLKASGDHTGSFMRSFFSFCEELRQRGQTVTLRPHPGGQYVLKNKVRLPRNVNVDTRPIYQADLGSYGYGVSAPSSVLFDMVLAGVPVGMWRDPEGTMDSTSYQGLTEISGPEDWLSFERDVRLRREMILSRQHAFLDRLAMPTDPAEVYRRYARLVVAGLERATAWR